jgi:NADH dehydrogenase
LRSTSRALRAYGLSGIDPDSFVRITLLNADPRLLLQLPEHVAESVHQTLDELKVAIRNDAQVIGVEPASVTLKSGEQIHSDLTIWTAGVKAPALLRSLGGLETNRLDQIVVTSELRSKTDPAILAMGDCAAAPWAGHKTPVPPRAQAAHQQARYLVKAIPRILRGKDVAPFQYNDLGSLLSLGRNSTIGTLMGFVRGAGIELEGAVASLLYRWLYEQHRAELFGWWTVIMNRLGRWLASRTQPRVKLH